MPAQTTQAETVYYVENDTAPDLEACLKDKFKNPIDLSGAEVTISIAFSMPRNTYYTSPRDQIVFRSPCEVDPDQTEDGRRGFVTWTPENRGIEDRLTPPGQFLYTFQVTFPDGSHQTIPANTYETMIILTPVGGRSLNQPPT